MLELVVIVKRIDFEFSNPKDSEFTPLWKPSSAANKDPSSKYPITDGENFYYPVLISGKEGVEEHEKMIDLGRLTQK